MTCGKAVSGRSITVVGAGLLVLALPAWAAHPAKPVANDVPNASIALDQTVAGSAVNSSESGKRGDGTGDDRDAAEVAAAPPKLAERVLRERQVLGTRFHGNVFIDGLPVGPDGVQIGQSLELRRARLSFSRQLPLRWEAEGSIELSNRALELKDLYLRRRFDRVGAVTLGNQSEPMGLNELASPLAQPLLEPSMATALVPGRNFGIALANRHQNFHYQIGAFGSGTQQEGRRDLGAAFTGRLTHRVIDPSGEVLHLGFGLSDRKLEGSEQFRTVPEVGLGVTELVDTGSIDGARDTRRASIEYIQTFGRLSVQGELIRVGVSRDSSPDVQFGGAYIEAAWMAWGNGPQYADADAVLSRAPVTTKTTWGDAWGHGNLALIARLSRIDLTDQEIQGGTETNLTLGATWDLNPRARLAVNLVRFIELTGPNAEAENSMAVALRYQYAW